VACDEEIILFRLALLQSIAGRLLCTLEAGIIKIGAKAVGNAPYTCFQLAGVSLRRNLAGTIPRRMQTLMPAAAVRGHRATAKSAGQELEQVVMIPR